MLIITCIFFSYNLYVLMFHVFELWMICTTGINAGATGTASTAKAISFSQQKFLVEYVVLANSLTSYIALVFYSELPSVCVIHNSYVTFIHMWFILFLVILTIALTCATGATCRIIEIIEKQIDKLSIDEIKLKSSSVGGNMLLI